MNPYEASPGNGSPAHGHDGQGIGQRVDQIGSSAHQLWDEASRAAADLSGALDLKNRVQRSPYAMMAAAFGVGYLLGGGLFTPLTARMVRLGVRLAALPFVKDELLGMAEAAMQGFNTTARPGGMGMSGPGGAGT
jgi:hypothetical protein